MSEVVHPVAEMKPSKDVSATTLTEGSKPTSHIESLNINKEKSQGIVLAKVLSSTSTPQPAHTGVVSTLPVSISSLSHVESKSLSTCVRESSSIIVTSPCVASVIPMNTIVTSASNSTLNISATVPQKQMLNIYMPDDRVQSELSGKRPRGTECDEEDVGTIAKKLKSSSIDVTNSSALATSDIESSEAPEASDAPKASDIKRETNEMEAAIDMSEVVNGMLPECKPEPKSRRKSTSRSKQKVSTSNASTRSLVTAICCLCHKKDSELNLGFLFGPYKRTVNNLPTSEVDSLDNVWIHEGCAVWTPGICLVGTKLIGLQEAISDAEKLVCM